MPDLDVTDILADSDIAGEQITIIRAKRTVSQYGITVDSPYSIITYGNVQPASGQQLQQFPEEQRTGAFISVTVPVMLIPLSRSNAPDLILHNGQNYRVITVSDYANYGQGYYQATAQLVDTVLIETA